MFYLQKKFCLLLCKFRAKIWPLNLQLSNASVVVGWSVFIVENNHCILNTCYAISSNPFHRIGSRGRCYDHNFLKNQCYDQIIEKLCFVLSKNAIFSTFFAIFWQKYFQKFIESVPASTRRSRRRAS
jgi:hypothetical protein